MSKGRLPTPNTVAILLEIEYDKFDIYNPLPTEKCPFLRNNVWKLQSFTFAFIFFALIFNEIPSFILQKLYLKGLFVIAYKPGNIAKIQKVQFLSFLRNTRHLFSIHLSKKGGFVDFFNKREGGERVISLSVTFDVDTCDPRASRRWHLWRS